MQGIAARAPEDPKSFEQRREERRRTLLYGKVVDLTGSLTLDCTIRDTSAHGARIILPEKCSVPDQLFLLNIRKRIAYLSAVVWRRSDQMGLSLKESHPVSGRMPHRLSFLHRILVDTKLQHIDELLARGTTLQDALFITDINDTTYKHWRNVKSGFGV